MVQGELITGTAEDFVERVVCPGNLQIDRRGPRRRQALIHARAIPGFDDVIAPRIHQQGWWKWPGREFDRRCRTIPVRHLREGSSEKGILHFTNSKGIRVRWMQIGIYQVHRPVVADDRANGKRSRRVSRHHRQLGTGGAPDQGHAFGIGIVRASVVANPSQGGTHIVQLRRPPGAGRVPVVDGEDHIAMRRQPLSGLGIRAGSATLPGRRRSAR